MTIDCVPVHPEHARGLEALFDAAGSPCFCRWWHFDGDDNAWQLRCATDPDANRLEQREALAGGNVLGVVALDGHRVVGWLKLAPAEAVPKMTSRRLYRAEPWFRESRDGVFMIGCVLVHPEFRRRGVAAAMIRATPSIARAAGARAVEALPRRVELPARDEALWNGPLSTLEAVGFERVAGSDGHPVMRIEWR